MHSKQIFSSKILTPLGTMTAFYDKDELHSLSFVDTEHYHRQHILFNKTDVIVLPIAETKLMCYLADELAQYFLAERTHFTVPQRVMGTAFQQRIWRELSTIAHGETRSYKALAHAVGNPSGFRAVAQANRANPFTILVPCHRIIAADGSLGGYYGGIERKRWLLEHEKRHATHNNFL
jgi:AraC family transcriptional regulator, regulatory protein of adaptative response / methylated-DNA-[protein]-cysteine methyltransferase